MIFRKMLGGGGANGSAAFPGYLEENRVQYENNTLPQLELFGHGEYNFDLVLETYSSFY